jgi:hypothetical protein
MARYLLGHLSRHTKNIKAMSIEDPHTALLDTVESESCNYESVSTDTLDPNKGSVDPHMNGTLQVVKSMKYISKYFIPEITKHTVFFIAVVFISGLE